MSDQTAAAKIYSASILGLVEMLREEGIEGVRYTLYDMTNWHRDYDPCFSRCRATEEYKHVGWEMWVRMEKILCCAPHLHDDPHSERSLASASPPPFSLGVSLG
jgi:hypothetical protein